MSPPVSVVVVSFNNYAGTTGPCLASLLAGHDPSACEIVVVDNASSDGARERIEAALRDRPGVRLVANRENRGFAGGNNDGVDAARGALVVLLNSDTRVPAGAVERLGRLLIERPDWGMIGPVTNEAGNEQKIFTRGDTPEAILEEGRDWCRHAEVPPIATARLDFFCVALPRRLYLELGGLDEDFGPGYFEDTDFSLRARSRGVCMGFTEAVFVYHRGGQSFSRQGSRYVHRLMRANRRRLRAKHPGGVRLRHLRDCNLDVLAHYADRAAELPPGEGRDGLGFRFANRRRLAESLDPRGPLKRWRYRRRLSDCERRLRRALDGKGG